MFEFKALLIDLVNLEYRAGGPRIDRLVEVIKDKSTNKREASS
jgi:hypothetical protein